MNIPAGIFKTDVTKMEYYLISCNTAGTAVVVDCGTLTLMDYYTYEYDKTQKTVLTDVRQWFFVLHRLSV